MTHSERWYLLALFLRFGSTLGVDYVILEGKVMDKKEIILALILVCLLGIAGKMDYNDAVADSQLTHRSEQK